MSRTLNDWARAAFEGAVKRGFHKEATPATDYHVDPQRILSRIALIHSELSEAVEECARGRMSVYYSTDPQGRQKPEGFGIELADAFLRLADLAGSLGMDLEALVEIKHEYNRERPLMHGGKRV